MNKPVGCFAGHHYGLTYVDLKGDGRYLITNSKDQSIKLWDMRAFSSLDAVRYTRNWSVNKKWDYRYQLPANFCKLAYLDV